jgi:hypothetical protein
MFSPGVFGSRLIVNLCCSEVRALQMNSRGLCGLEPSDEVVGVDEVSADAFGRRA